MDLDPTFDPAWAFPIRTDCVAILLNGVAKCGTVRWNWHITSDFCWATSWLPDLIYIYLYMCTNNTSMMCTYKKLALDSVHSPHSEKLPLRLHVAKTHMFNSSAHARGDSNQNNNRHVFGYHQVTRLLRHAARILIEWFFHFKKLVSEIPE
jgi:hypothetical protein